MKRVLGYCITLAAFIFLGYYLVSNISSLSFSSLHLRGYQLFLSGILLISFFIFRGFGWHTIMRQHGTNIPFRDSFYYLSKSEIIRYIPGNVWGMGARILQAKHFGSTTPIGVAMLFEEIIILISSSAALITFSTLFLLSERWSPIVLILCITVTITPWILYRSVFSLTRILQRFIPIQLHQSLLSRQKLFFSSFWYLCAWLCFGLSHIVLAKALFPNTSNILIFSFSLFSWLCGYVSLLTPSGLGIRELVMTLGLAPMFGQSLSALFSLASRLWITIIEIVVYCSLFCLRLVYRRYGTKE